MTKKLNNIVLIIIPTLYILIYLVMLSIACSRNGLEIVSYFTLVFYILTGTIFGIAELIVLWIKRPKVISMEYTISLVLCIIFSVVPIGIILIFQNRLTL